MGAQLKVGEEKERGMVDLFSPKASAKGEVKDEERSLAAAAARAYYLSMAQEFERLSTVPLDKLSKTERERWLGVAQEQIRRRSKNVRRD